MNILVTGGAGYIGSFMSKKLLDSGHNVVVFDNLSHGHKDAIDSRATFIQGDLLEKTLEDTLRGTKFDAVIHFAAFISVAESMINPGDYFRNNTLGTLKLLDGMAQFGVKYIIFSSTAAVYGSPQSDTLSEDHRKLPENPYGESKLMTEKILEWYQKIYGINSVRLRYFNAAGAALDGSMGERHNPGIHLIPNVIQALLSKKEFHLFGTDYPTPDGTCVRDYIHVLDLADAHMLALGKIHHESGSFAYNVGTGKGYSVKEVVAAVEAISGKKCQVAFSPRRPGDPSKLVANVEKIKKELSFQPKYSDLDTIVSSSWQWHKAWYEKRT